MPILARARAALFLLLLAAPPFLTAVPLLHPDGLRGYEPPAVREPLTPASWWSGRFQEALEPWYAQRLGVRPYLVRTDNQLALTLFGETRGRTPVVIGRDRWLYEGVYVDKYRSADRSPQAALERTVARLRRLQDLLEARGIPLVLIVAPSKPEIYPEYLPPGASDGRAGRRSAYDRLAPMLAAAGIEMVDVHRLFLEERARGNPAQLFPQGGTHWNHWGDAFVVQRLLDALERHRPGRHVRIVLEGARTDEAVHLTDDDIAGLLNIWFTRPYLGLQTHPVFTRVEAGRTLPRLLFAGDSFMLNVMDFMREERLMQPSDGIYYLRERIRFPGREFTPYDARAMDMERELAGIDAVVLVSSEYWMPEVAFGFAPAAVASLERARKARRDERRAARGR